MNTKNNSILALDLLEKETINKIVLHIPHASINIPLMTGYNKDVLDNEINKLTDWYTDEIFNVVLDNEINKLTDWYTDEIFNVENVTTIKADFSRLFCDVERFSNDNLEIMFKYGRGFFYTHTDDGKELRENNLELKNKILNNYYLPYHNMFDNIIEDKLKKYNEAIIIDCHSFSDIPFNTNSIKTENQPDICIGTDNYHTIIEHISYMLESFTHLGYSVGLNTPYSGTIVNNSCYQKDKRVKSIMIEINKKLYMNNNFILQKQIKLLNKQIKTIIYSM